MMVNIGWLMYPIKLLFPLTRKLDSVNEYVWDCLLWTLCNVLKMNDIMVNHLYSPIFLISIISWRMPSARRPCH